MSFHLCPATAEDLPGIVQVASRSFNSDTHTRLKAIAKGYGSSSEGTARYHSQGMIEGYGKDLENPKRDVIVAKSDSGEVLGTVTWVMKDRVAQSNDTSESSPKTSPLTTNVDISPPPPPSSTLPRTVPNMETVTNAAMRHYVSHLMPPDTNCRYIGGINVLPAHQGKGIGAALVNWGLERARSEGVFCWVSSSMVGVRFFEKVGFVEVGRLELDLDEWAEGIKQPVHEDTGSGQTAPREELWGRYVWTWMKWTP